MASRRSSPMLRCRRWHSYIVVGGLFMLLLITICCSTVSFAKEIEATDEWQLLGENDTVAAGLHIRMDLSTGEKWVKLNDDQENEEEKGMKDETALTKHVEISSDGSVVEVSDEDVIDQASSSQEPQYDFDMMHRTLSQLPEDEKERMGLPTKPPTTISPEQEWLYQQRMKRIWERRQDELKAWQEDYLADLPQVLKDRIRAMREYLEDPLSQLTSINLDEETSTDKEDDEQYITNIIHVLTDLEYHLSDVDMARDFFTLGGWPELVALMTDAVHFGQNSTSLDPTVLYSKIHAVQANAAWALGTAVKNAGEFGPYAVEPVKFEKNDKRTATTALDVLLEHLRGPSDDEDAAGRAKLELKCLYALGSLLRGNRVAQVHLVAAGGASVLGQRLLASTMAHNNKQAKLAKRLLTLADDLITDVRLHPGDSPQVDEAIVQAFSSEDWCQATALALQGKDASIREAALHAVHSLARHCVWDDKKELQPALIQLQDDWKADESMDPDVLQERLHRIQSTVDMLFDTTVRLEEESQEAIENTA